MAQNTLPKQKHIQETLPCLNMFCTFRTSLFSNNILRVSQPWEEVEINRCFNDKLCPITSVFWRDVGRVGHWNTSNLKPPKTALSLTRYHWFLSPSTVSKLQISLLLFNGDCNLQSINMTFLITWDVDVVLERWDTADSKRVVRAATAGPILPCQPCVSLLYPETHQTGTQGPAVQPYVLDGIER